ncbi:hypothetical protein OSB04_009368 [Centaurea solstitialis]|uniref:Uncharacterized protein n=1 Tax=Centaurea solstitialis TaxID=347529 RepID=A0AA38T769_9ASTR|nr:hypothetical protein OSB04_009368 [Centaurea solstitialis]
MATRGGVKPQVSLQLGQKLRLLRGCGMVNLFIIGSTGSGCSSTGTTIDASETTVGPFGTIETTAGTSDTTIGNFETTIGTTRPPLVVVVVVPEVLLLLLMAAGVVLVAVVAEVVIIDDFNTKSSMQNHMYNGGGEGGAAAATGGEGCTGGGFEGNDGGAAGTGGGFGGAGGTGDGFDGAGGTGGGFNGARSTGGGFEGTGGGVGGADSNASDGGVGSGGGGSDVSGGGSDVGGGGVVGGGGRGGAAGRDGGGSGGGGGGGGGGGSGGSGGASKSDDQNRFSRSMLWIGIYIVVASLFCILLMVADLLHGLRNRKLWFPCKYFTLNAATLTVIAVAMKLPMDLNNPMLGRADQAAKLGNMAFMCTMMANLLPSLSTMDSKELLTNIIALGVPVITLVVNVCIQVETGIVSYTILLHEVILITQFIGVMVGSIAPISRCFAPLSFKLSIKWIWNHIKVFKVESYWTQTLSDWKRSSVPITFRSRKFKVVIQKLKILILCFCIGFQKAFVVACKMIGLVPIFIVIGVLYCFRCWKWLKATFNALGIVLEKRSEHNKHLSRYVLQLQDDMELAERTLKGISKSVNHLIRRSEKQQPFHLVKLLEESRGFEGVGKFNNHLVPPLPSQEFLDCWSLPLVTLTTIAISLPNIQSDAVDNLLSSVSEGLLYVKLVEESLNATEDYVCIQKAAETLWLEVEVYHKWLGNRLQKPVPQLNTVWQILHWFKDTAKSMVTEVEQADIGDGYDDSIYRSISANSMYRITETILLSYHTNIEEVSQEELFGQLSSMISDILAACLTNLPKVIAIKCHASAIEKREASVHAAAQLLGETTQIINSLQDRELPSLNQNELAFMDKWCAYFQQHPSP